MRFDVKLLFVEFSTATRNPEVLDRQKTSISTKSSRNCPEILLKYGFVLFFEMFAINIQNFISVQALFSRHVPKLYQSKF